MPERNTLYHDIIKNRGVRLAKVAGGLMGGIGTMLYFLWTLQQALGDEEDEHIGLKITSSLVVLKAASNAFYYLPSVLYGSFNCQHNTMENFAALFFTGHNDVAQSEMLEELLLKINKRLEAIEYKSFPENDTAGPYFYSGLNSARAPQYVPPMPDIEEIRSNLYQVKAEVSDLKAKQNGYETLNTQIQELDQRLSAIEQSMADQHDDHSRPEHPV